MNYEIQHAGTSGEWRKAGDVATIKMAVAASRELMEEGYEVRIMRAGRVWMNAEEIRTGNGPAPLPKNWKAT
jgi:hypothetical protein